MGRSNMARSGQSGSEDQPSSSSSSSYYDAPLYLSDSDLLSPTLAAAPGLPQSTHASGLGSSPAGNTTRLDSPQSTDNRDPSTPHPTDASGPHPRRAVSLESGLMSPQPSNAKTTKAKHKSKFKRSPSGFNAEAAVFKPSKNLDSPRWGSEDYGSHSTSATMPAQFEQSYDLFPDKSGETPTKPLKSPSSKTPRSWGSRSLHSRSSSLASQRPDKKVSPLAYKFAQGDLNGSLQQGMFDPYLTSSSPLPSSHGQHQAQINPYAQDTTASNNSQYFQTNTYAQPLQYHLYASLGPHRENLLPYQRAAHDFFINDNMREDLQRKSAATQQILPSTKVLLPIRR